MRAIDQERVALMLLWAVLIVLYGWWPELDIAVSQMFYVPEVGFPAKQWAWLLAFDTAVPWVGRLVFVAAIWVVVWQSWQGRRRRPSRLWRQSAVFILTVILGLGLVVHALLKDHWGRARPDQVQMFGGSASYSGPLQPSKACPQNCSFVSGHAATGFAFIAVGMLGGTARRRRWLLIGTVCGLVVGLDRMALGRHFLGDILFCLAIMWSSVMLIRWGWILTMTNRLRRKKPQTAPPAPPHQTHSPNP